LTAPDHMKGFVRSQEVVNSFKAVALSRPLSIRPIAQELATDRRMFICTFLIYICMHIF